jgi:hypothetical protein
VLEAVTFGILPALLPLSLCFGLGLSSMALDYVVGFLAVFWLSTTVVALAASVLLLLRIHLIKVNSMIEQTLNG